MAKRLVARIAADTQSSSVKECSSEHCAWYVIVGRILMILAMPIVPAVMFSMLVVVLYGLLIEIAQPYVNLSIIECMLNHPLAIAGVFYLVILIAWIYKLSRLIESNLNGGEHNWTFRSKPTRKR